MDLVNGTAQGASTFQSKVLSGTSDAGKIRFRSAAKFSTWLKQVITPYPPARR